MKTLSLWLLMTLPAIAVGCSLWNESEVCQACRRPLHAQTSYQITFDNGDKEKLCCPRCGLHVQTGRDDVSAAHTTDYSTGNLIEAETALYVESSDVMLCCPLDKQRRDRSGGLYTLQWDRCMPSLVSFDDREAAERFRDEHGGVIKSFAELRSEPDFTNPLMPRAHP